jgi:hypothetical protein
MVHYAGNFPVFTGFSEVKDNSLIQDDQNILKISVNISAEYQGNTILSFRKVPYGTVPVSRGFFNYDTVVFSKSTPVSFSFCIAFLSASLT